MVAISYWRVAEIQWMCDIGRGTEVYLGMEGKIRARETHFAMN